MVKRSLRLLIVLLLSLFISVPVYATDVSSNAYQEYIKGGKFNGSGVTDDIVDGFFSESGGASSKEQREVKSLMYGENGERVDQYSQCSDESKLKVKNKISQIASDSYTKNQVSQIGTDFNIQADIGTAATALRGLQPFISTITGIIVIIVVTFASFYTAMDIMFITMPTFRNQLDELAQNGGKMSKDTKDGGTKFRFVTDEAVIAVKLCTIENGKNALAEYMKRRIWAIMILGLAIFILLTGNIDIFVNIMINIASGFIEMLSGLGA